MSKRPNNSIHDNKKVRIYESLRLRRKGYSLKEIADELGTSLSTASRDVRECLAIAIKRGEKDIDKYRELELVRLDKMLKNIQDKVDSGSLLALDRALKIMVMRARLLGLEAPVKTENSEEITFVLPEINKK